ncbi:hydantoinase/oxoprolinase family protein [Elongatibacter sediminis]|uniref:Hydantoinase/oxoprolinase family protein n=1 Tax=Elongatibacter sediminis TaxID=3119006 RepID=A0AAW9R6J3_9GAMM
MRIGVDVGGTNTDAVIMEGSRVLASAKRPTTEDVAGGMVAAIRAVLDDSQVPVSDIHSVMVGTTQFINAFVERKHLSEVAIIRIALPLSEGIPPLVDWPDDLRAAIGEHIYMVGGGCYYTGAEYMPLDEEALVKAARDIRDKGLEAVAITSIFAPIRQDYEERAAAIIREYAPDVAITQSNQVGSLNLVERENAAVINASLMRLSRQVIDSYRKSLAALDINGRLYVTQNDGTLMSAEAAEQNPVMTCSAGPTNSMRGAGFLSGLKEAVVIDIGGTTTDVGFLHHGFPRETTDANDIGGVRTNFSMPDVLSIGLGGGSIVAGDAEVTVGPASVGYRILQEARIFGGSTLTATDIAVASGQADIGDASAVSTLPSELVENALSDMHSKIETALDRMKTSARAVPAVLVGGGHVLVSRSLKGVSELHRPEHASVANAIGAAIGQVGARIKRIVEYGDSGRDEVIRQVSEEVKRDVVEAGGIPETVKVVEIEEMQMTYLQANAVSLKIRAIGDLATGD